MAEYIDREVALKIVTDMMCDCKVTHKGRAIRRNIKQIPIADVVEVVRCKDCDFYKAYSDPLKGFYGQCLVRECNIGENDFCSYGVKKEGAEK